MDIHATLTEAAANHAQGRLDEAESGYRSVIAFDPTVADSFHLLGMVLFQKKNLTEAAQLIFQATELNPQNPSFFQNLAIVYNEMEFYDQACQALLKAKQLDPDNVSIIVQLAHTNRRLGEYEIASSHYNAVLEIEPDNTEALAMLGITYEHLGDLNAAEPLYRQSVSINERPDTLFNLGNILKDRHDTDEAISCYSRAILNKPDFAEAHVHLAYALLAKGDYPSAWEEYEWRWKVPVFGNRQFPSPRWEGQSLEGKTLLIHAEQGFGDTLQFCRLIKDVPRQSTQIIFECQPALVRLLERVGYIDKVIPQGEVLPQHDYNLPLLSLPRRLELRPQTIPNTFPYLDADPAETSRWRDKLQKPGLNLGVVWQGTAEKRNTAARACSLEDIKQLFQIPGTNWYSLQKEIPVTDRPLPEALTDLSAELSDFAATAAIISSLDLVVSIDTGVAHLVSALGKPVMVLLAASADWRWVEQDNKCLWYPNAHLFRQKDAENWTEPVNTIAEQITALAKTSQP